MSITWRQVGATTPDSAIVVVKTTGSTISIGVDTDSSFPDRTVYGPRAVPPLGIVKFELSGLDPDTRYYYTFEEDGEWLVFGGGRFYTHPPVGSQASYTVGFMSCAHGHEGPGSGDILTDNPDNDSGFVRLSNHPVFETIREADSLFNVHQGDEHYYDLGSGSWGIQGGASLENYRRAYDDVLLQPRQRHVRADTATVSLWDDHDYGPDNSDGTHYGKHNVAQAYREYKPHYPLEQSGAIYHARQVGRVLWVFSDTRFHKTPNSANDDENKTMLGATQKAWFRDLLANPPADAEVLIWACPTDWMGGAGDSWNGFKTERSELAQMFRDTGWEDRMCQVAGNFHGNAIDVGTGNYDWTGARFPCFVFCSVDSFYGTTPVPPGESRYDQGHQAGSGQWGTISIVDRGGYIMVTGTAYDGAAGEDVWGTHSFTVIPGISDPRERDLELEYDDRVSRVRVRSRELVPYTQFTDTFATEESNGWGVADTGQPWQVDSGDPEHFYVSYGGGDSSKARIAVPDGDSTRHVITSTAVSQDTVDLRTSITLHHVAAAASINPGLLVRYQDINNFYMLQAQHLTNSTVQLGIYRRRGGSFTALSELVNIGAYEPLRLLHVRFAARGQSLAGKAWLDGDDEPADWQALGSDASFTSGDIGTHVFIGAANTNPKPVSVNFEEFTTTPPPPALVSVERATNGDDWVPLRGASTRTVHPGETFAVDDYEFIPTIDSHYRLTVYDGRGVLHQTLTDDITVDDDRKWLKSPQYPFLNQPVLVTDEGGSYEFAARGETHTIIGRSAPVAVSGIRTDPSTTIQVMSQTTTERENMRSLLKPGVSLYLHGPPGFIPGGAHYSVGTVTGQEIPPGGDVYLWELPLTMVEGPSPDLVGATATWMHVMKNYPTWQDLMDACPTWSDVLDLVGEPSDLEYPL